MAAYDVQVKGATELVNTLRAITSPMPALAEGLTEHAEVVITDAKEQYVPVDLGVLKNSGHVQPATIHGTVAEVRLGFGGAAQDYALIQHENLSFRHTTGGPKYLERPVLAHAKDLPTRIADAVRAWLQRVGR